MALHAQNLRRNLNFAIRYRKNNKIMILALLQKQLLRVQLKIIVALVEADMKTNLSLLKRKVETAMHSFTRLDGPTVQRTVQI